MRLYGSKSRYLHVHSNPSQCRFFPLTYPLKSHRFWPHFSDRGSSWFQFLSWLTRPDWSTWLLIWLNKILYPLESLSIFVFFFKIKRLYFLMATFMLFFVSMYSFIFENGPSPIVFTLKYWLMNLPYGFIS